MPLLTYRSIILPKHGSINLLILKILTSSLTHQREYTCNAGPFHVVFTFRGEGGLLKKVFREARLRAEVQPLKPFFTNKILLSYTFYRQMTW